MRSSPTALLVIRAAALSLAFAAAPSACRHRHGEEAECGPSFDSSLITLVPSDRADATSMGFELTVEGPCVVVARAGPPSAGGAGARDYVITFDSHAPAICHVSLGRKAGAEPAPPPGVPLVDITMSHGACEDDSGTYDVFSTDPEYATFTILPSGAAIRAGAGGTGSDDCGVLTMGQKIATPLGDLYPESALPVGACAGMPSCGIVTIHPCDCGGFGATTSWSCACTASGWECFKTSMGASACMCPGDAGAD